jgi:hypothetical protein
LIKPTSIGIGPGLGTDEMGGLIYTIILGVRKTFGLGGRGTQYSIQ